MNKTELAKIETDIHKQSEQKEEKLTQAMQQAKKDPMGFLKAIARGEFKEFADEDN